MKIGDKVSTPRFMTVTISAVFDSPEDARRSEYTEPTHYDNDPEYDIHGKHEELNRMTFAAVLKGVSKRKTIKLFDGIKITTNAEVKKYPAMTAFDEVVKCTDEQKGDIIRLLLMYGTVDLTDCTEDKSRCMLDLYTD